MSINAHFVRVMYSVCWAMAVVLITPLTGLGHVAWRMVVIVIISLAIQYLVLNTLRDFLQIKKGWSKEKVYRATWPVWGLVSVVLLWLLFYQLAYFDRLRDVETMTQHMALLVSIYSTFAGIWVAISCFQNDLRGFFLSR